MVRDGSNAGAIRCYAVRKGGDTRIMISPLTNSMSMLRLVDYEWGKERQDERQGKR